ncbi:MAG TPA: hypothetical protein VF221_09460 [Chloroflexota bacterium]
MYIQITKAPVKRGTKRDVLENIWRDLMPDFRSSAGFHVLYPLTDDNVLVAGAISLWDRKDDADAAEPLFRRAIDAFSDFYESEPSVEGYQASILT